MAHRVEMYAVQLCALMTDDRQVPYGWLEIGAQAAQGEPFVAEEYPPVHCLTINPCYAQYWVSADPLRRRLRNVYVTMELDDASNSND